jgi:hypothetical protein
VTSPAGFRGQVPTPSLPRGLQFLVTLFLGALGPMCPTWLKSESWGVSSCHLRGGSEVARVLASNWMSHFRCLGDSPGPHLPVFLLELGPCSVQLSHDCPCPGLGLCSVEFSHDGTCLVAGGHRNEPGFALACGKTVAFSLTSGIWALWSACGRREKRKTEKRGIWLPVLPCQETSLL